MSHENDTTNEGLRSLAAELERRRDRIAKAQRGLGVIVGAYDLTLADLRSAASGKSDPATGSEATTA